MNITNTLNERFSAAAVGKVHKLCREGLCELKASCLVKK